MMVQTSVFSNENPLFFTLNHIVVNFFFNIDIPSSERVVLFLEMFTLRIIIPMVVLKNRFIKIQNRSNFGSSIYYTLTIFKFINVNRLI